MKRLMFASMIFLLVPAFAQTKAGRTDTVKHAVFYACAPGACCCTNAATVTAAAKEQRAAQSAKHPAAKICISPLNRRRMNLSAKEAMKMEVTRSTN